MSTTSSAVSFHAWKLSNTSFMARGILLAIPIFRKEVSRNLRGPAALVRLMAQGLGVEKRIARFFAGTLRSWGRTLGLEPPKPEALAPVAPAPGAPPSPELARADGLPDFAKKADDLEAIKQAVDDAASVGGGLWLSYLFVLFYLAIAAGAVTHADLFLENPVKLPFLNVELPLLAFFFLAPILFLFVHAYTLVHLVFLTDKAKRFDQALSTQIGDDSVAAKDSNDPRIAAIAGVRGQLPSNIFIEFLAGPRDRRAGSFGWLLRAIAWSTLAVAPILLLLLFQLQFLPFHLSWITWTHRLALVADLVLIWWLWRKILSGREADPDTAKTSGEWRTVGLVLSAFVILFSLTAATFPGEWLEDHWPDGRPFLTTDEEGQPKAVSLHDRVFNSKVDDITRRRWLPFSSTLVLTGFNIYEGLKIDDPEKLKGRDFIFRARGRDLTGAIFDFAVLPKVDFEGAELQGASLGEAQLQGASFERTQLQGARLELAELRVASLDKGQLQGASLDGATLQGASLRGAQLQGARLDDAQLQGASLKGAELQGASLDGATLQGASLLGARLQGASLENAELQGASLAAAELQGASVKGTALEATDLSDAFLWRTRGDPKSTSSVLLPEADDTWRPVWRDYWYKVRPWGDKAYGDLQRSIEAFPPSDVRDQALKRVRALDCADQALASCDLASPPAPAAWSKDAQTNGAPYLTALAAELRTFVCSGDDDAVYILRGGGFQGRLLDAGAAATGLIDDLMDKDSKGCPVSPALTDADRAKLLQVKHLIEQDQAPPPPPPP
jgi:uncharacterized protein YjbI with pentapeptide repeats